MLNRSEIRLTNDENSLLCGEIYWLLPSNQRLLRPARVRKAPNMLRLGISRHEGAEERRVLKR